MKNMGSMQELSFHHMQLQQLIMRQTLIFVINLEESFLIIRRLPLAI